MPRRQDKSSVPDPIAMLARGRLTPAAQSHGSFLSRITCLRGRDMLRFISGDGAGVMRRGSAGAPPWLISLAIAGARGGNGVSGDRGIDRWGGGNLGALLSWECDVFRHLSRWDVANGHALLGRLMVVGRGYVEGAAARFGLPIDARVISDWLQSRGRLIRCAMSGGRWRG